MLKKQMHCHFSDRRLKNLPGNDNNYNFPIAKVPRLAMMAIKPNGAAAEYFENTTQLQNNSSQWVSIYFFGLN